MKTILWLCFAFSVAAPLTAADVSQANSAPAAQTQQMTAERLIDTIVERERALLASLEQRSPLVETYIQLFAGQQSPTGDHYFLGRMRFGPVISYASLVEHTDPPPKRGSRLPFFSSSSSASPLSFLPRGFAQMAVLDSQDFNRQTYRFEFVRREFLGEVRCLVFDVSPLDARQPGKFVGRTWVEDRGYAIVRFNGTYVQRPAPKHAVPERYFHFDSWRVETSPGAWAPSQIYVEEDGAQGSAPAGPAAAPPIRFKAQTRLWDYATARSDRLDELTGILIDPEAGARDEASAQDISPLESQRAWERQAEDNLLARLEKGGLLAPAGPVEQVLNTVVSNLIVAGRLGIDARCRLLLTTPAETFSIGHTIVISRGLVDVLPDETSLALVLAGELTHIALGHRTPTQFAFYNQTMLSDAELLARLRLQRPPEEMLAAGKKTMEIMQASPYQDTGNAGLFLKALAARGQALPRLLQANLGNQVADAAALARLQAFAEAAPALEEDKLEQIAALPLGSRVRLNPWTNRTSMLKVKPLSLLAPREKMPFEVTPFAPHLTRAEPAPK